LITVLAGIVTSMLSLSKWMTSLLHHYPIQVDSFFFGLILISSPLVLRQIKKWDVITAFSFLIGIGGAYWITVVSPAETPANLMFIFISGVLAFCAMALPGVSGAFILLLIGKYEFMATALAETNIPVILVFVLGCFMGLLGLSRFLSFILAQYRFRTLALLSGFMIGSLNRLWPWREVIAFRINLEGHQVAAFDRSILPGNYLKITGNDPRLFQAILFAALGVFLVVAVEKIAAVIKSK
jgi:putative membrane protein